MNDIEKSGLFLRIPNGCMHNLLHVHTMFCPTGHRKWINLRWIPTSRRGTNERRVAWWRTQYMAITVLKHCWSLRFTVSSIDFDLQIWFGSSTRYNNPIAFKSDSYDGDISSLIWDSQSLNFKGDCILISEMRWFICEIEWYGRNRLYILLYIMLHEYGFKLIYRCTPNHIGIYIRVCRLSTVYL